MASGGTQNQNPSPHIALANTLKENNKNLSSFFPHPNQNSWRGEAGANTKT